MWPDGGGDCRYTVGEGGVGLVGEAVVVLDEVDAASGEAFGELGEAGWREALGFQGGAGQGAAEGAGAMAQAVDAVVGAGENRGERGGDLDVQKHDVVVQGGVAEHHVEELAGVVADGCGGQCDADVELAVAAVVDGFDLADDFVVDRRVVDRVERHFDALLDGDGLRSGFDRGGVGGDAVGRGEAILGGAPSIPGGTPSPTLPRACAGEGDWCGGQMLEVIQSFRRLLGRAPTWVAAGWPFLNRIRVGMPRTA